MKRRLAALLVLLTAAACTPDPTPSPAPAPPSSPVSSGVGVSPTPTPIPTPTPTPFGQRTFGPTPAFTPPARVRCPTATVTVSTATALRAAVAAARPGSVVAVTAGTYRTSLRLTARATRARPVFVCGRGRVVIEGGGTGAGPVVELRGARYWRLVDLTLRSGSEGVSGRDADHSVLQDLTITRTGGAGVAWRTGSAGNLLRDSTVSDTGILTRTAGQGVVVGTPATAWCRPSRCVADENNDNVVLDTRVRDTSGSAVRAYEGSYNGVVYGLRINGAQMSADDAWVDIRGSSWLVAHNDGRHSLRDGFRAQVAAQGHGESNRFQANTGRDLNEGRGGGYLIALRPNRADLVSCDNTVPDRSAPRSNLRCSG